jgi:hypothetical protein
MPRRQGGRVTSNQRYFIAGAVLVAAVVFGVRDVPLAAVALYLVGATWCVICAVLDRGRLWGRLLMIWLPTAPLVFGAVLETRTPGDEDGALLSAMLLAVVFIVCLVASGIAFLAADRNGGNA